MSESKRYYSALIMIAAVILVIEMGGITAFYIIAFILAILSLDELRNIFLQNNISLWRVPLLLSGLAGVFYFSIALRDGIFPVFLFAFFIITLALKLKPLTGNVSLPKKIFLFLFSVILISVPLACMINIRGDDKGIIYVYGVLFATWASDSGAYFTGKKWGKRKMSPVVSPNKTYEGLAGGIFLTTVVFLLWHFAGNMPLGSAIVLGVLISLAATFGDLLESLLKRNAGVKDSGNIIPGHGGILDRIDALLFTAPVWYIFIKYFA